MRADIYLVKNGHSLSRARAQADIDEGRLYVNGINIRKCSYDVKDTDNVELRGEDMKFVGRGGLKLEGAICKFSEKAAEQDDVFLVKGAYFDCRGAICVDIGASTGGFTDCLLQHGAEKVFAVDCGSGQLHSRLRSDKRVVNIENFNARELTEKALGEKCDIAVMDVSFISQTLLFSAVADVLKNGGMLLSLIKPQFEAGRSALNGKGVVKDKKVHKTVIKKVVSEAEPYGLRLVGLAASPIEGGEGNREYLALFVKSAGASAFPEGEKLDRIVNL